MTRLNIKLANALETKQISITLPATWIEAIDTQTTAIKSRQDIVREWLEPKVTPLLKEEKNQ